MASSAFTPSIRRAILAAAIAFGGAVAGAAPSGASAASDGTSNTIMFAEASMGFMDYTDDACTLKSTACRHHRAPTVAGGQEGEE